MDIVSFSTRYFAWHYGTAFSDIARVFLNFGWFLWRFFSVPELLANLFVPFGRLEEKPKSALPADVAYELVATLILSILGATLRLPLIILGVVSLVLVSAAYVFASALWFALPALAPLLVALGPFIALGIL